MIGIKSQKIVLQPSLLSVKTGTDKGKTPILTGGIMNLATGKSKLNNSWPVLC